MFKYEEVKEYIESFGYKVLSTKYINYRTKLKLQCPKGHIWYSSLCNFKYRKNRCLTCANEARLLDDNYVKNYIESCGYKLLSKYKGEWKKLKIQCDKGHIYKATFHNFKTNHNRCPTCYYDSKKLKFDHVKNFVSSVNYTLLSTEYINWKEKLIIKCEFGHIFYPSWDNFFNGGSRCPVCNIEKQKTIYTEQELKKLKEYRAYIIKLSNRVYNKHYIQINPNKLKRSRHNYHLDHIYSVIDGFKNNVPPEVISNPNNLQMLSEHDNIAKLDRSDQTKQELYLRYYKYELEK